MTKAFTAPNSNHGPVVFVKGTWIKDTASTTTAQPFLSAEAEIRARRNSTSTTPHERQDARETQGGGGSGGGGGEDCIAPSNIAEVASAREIENGSLRLSLFPSTLLSLSLSLSL